MDIAMNMLIKADPTINGGKEAERGVPVNLNKQVDKKSFKEFILEKSGREDNFLTEKTLEKLKELLEMEPEMMERELQELDANLLMELAGLLNISVDRLLQELQPLIRGSGSGENSIEELKKSLLELKDTLNDFIVNLSGRKAKAKELPFKDSAVETNHAKAVKEDPFISMKLTGDEETVVSNIENTISTIVPTEEQRKIENSALDRSSRDYTLNEKITGFQWKKDSANQESAIINNNIDSLNQEQSIEKSVARNSIDNLFRDLSLNNELAPMSLETTKGEGSYGLKILAEDNQLYIPELDTEEPLMENKGDGDGQTGNLMGQHSWTDNIVQFNKGEMTLTARSDLEGIIEQISEKIQHQAGKNKIDLQLEPESLGKVKIELQVENTELTARLVVDNEQVRTYLEQNLEGLKSNLIRQGFNVEQIQIESRGHDYHGQYHSQQEFQQEQRDGEKERRGESTHFSYEEIEPLEGVSELVENIDSLQGSQKWMHLNYIRQRMNLLA